VKRSNLEAYLLDQPVYLRGEMHLSSVIRIKRRDRDWTNEEREILTKTGPFPKWMMEYERDLDP
jgi:hypothetical protein